MNLQAFVAMSNVLHESFLPIQKHNQTRINLSAHIGRRFMDFLTLDDNHLTALTIQMANVAGRFTATVDRVETKDIRTVKVDGQLRMIEFPELQPIEQRAIQGTYDIQDHIFRDENILQPFQDENILKTQARHTSNILRQISSMIKQSRHIEIDANGTDVNRSSVHWRPEEYRPFIEMAYFHHLSGCVTPPLYKLQPIQSKDVGEYRIDLYQSSFDPSFEWATFTKLNHLNEPPDFFIHPKLVYHPDHDSNVTVIFNEMNRPHDHYLTRVSNFYQPTKNRRWNLPSDVSDNLQRLGQSGTWAIADNRQRFNQAEFLVSGEGKLLGILNHHNSDERYQIEWIQEMELWPLIEMVKEAGFFADLLYA